MATLRVTQVKSTIGTSRSSAAPSARSSEADQPQPSSCPTARRSAAWFARVPHLVTVEEVS